MTESPKMKHYAADWTWQPEVCPADLHFTEYLEDRGIRGKTIFHFGTGSHHHVGLRCFENGSGNVVLGITASITEAEAYTRLAIDNPRLSRAYKAFFGDIYLLEPRLLPALDIVTLFHLCEFRTEEMGVQYGAMTDPELLDLLVDQTRPGGLVLFYTRSAAFDLAEPAIAAWSARRPVERAEDYKTLRVYRKLP